MPTSRYAFARLLQAPLGSHAGNASPYTSTHVFESQAGNAGILSFHSEVMPGMLPVHFHTFFSESQAGNAGTLLSHSSQKFCHESSLYTSTLSFESQAGNTSTLSSHSEVRPGNFL